MGRFVDREPAKRTKLDDLDEVSVQFLQAIEGLIECENGHPVCSGDVPGFIDWDSGRPLAPFARPVTTGVIDQDAAHDVRGDTEEMRSVLPVHPPLIDEADERLVDKGGRLQSVVGALAPKLTGGNASELRIDEGQQPVERSPVAATPIAEQRRDVARRDHLQFVGSKPKA